tara:strand:+ start:49 stop:489 length:441 start_codon:yes stop_codon:yes gene_type:complete
MDMIEVKTTTTGTMAILGNFELRAGSQGTEEHLGPNYPGALDAFAARQTDGANGYDPAPKMALLRVTLSSNASNHVLSGTGINSILYTAISQRGTKTAGDVLDSLSILTGAVGAADANTGKRDVQIELFSEGGAADASVDVMVMYN